MTLSWMTPQILSVAPQTQAWGVGLFFDAHRFATWISARSLAGSAEPLTWPTWFCGFTSDRLCPTAILFGRAGSVSDAGIVSEIVAVFARMRSWPA